MMLIRGIAGYDYSAVTRRAVEDTLFRHGA
jgi:hypothetical protein